MPFGIRIRGRSEIKRIYAIGDVHGRLDLFERLIAVIKRDHTQREELPTRIVMLGDLVDHGPDSRPLVQICKRLTEGTDRFVVLKGDHEKMMVVALRQGGMMAIDRWFDHGAAATLESWGVIGRSASQDDREALIEKARKIIGTEVIDWLDRLPLTLRHEEHLFVHAGIKPGVSLRAQQENDMLSIRQEFLESRADHGFIIVHGHSIHEVGPDRRGNRIGIDTGAYRTGRLTALGVESGESWSLMTAAASGKPTGSKDAAEFADLIAGLRSL